MLGNGQNQVVERGKLLQAVSDTAFIADVDLTATDRFAADFSDDLVQPIDTAACQRYRPPFPEYAPGDGLSDARTPSDYDDLTTLK